MHPGEHGYEQRSATATATATTAEAGTPLLSVRGAVLLFSMKFCPEQCRDVA